MLIWGTVNPVGERNNYRGFYLTKDDINRLVAGQEMVGKPVKIEHKGASVGKVISAWQNGAGQMDCVLELQQDSLEGAVISKFVDQGVCRELSLGYEVDVRQSEGTISATNKRVVEVSIVKKGARDKCFIHGFTSAGKRRRVA